MHGVAPYPLYWPLGQPRTQYRKSATFQVDFTTARTHLLQEISRLGGRDVVISTNVPIRRDGLPMVPDREPEDPGVAVYFTRKGKSIVIGCDRYTKIRWNLRALGSTLEAMRAIERHGTSAMLDQAFSGFAQLPSSTSRTWREVLEFPVGPVTRDQIEASYRELAKRRHPDVVGGSHEAMAELNGARDRALAELRA